MRALVPPSSRRPRSECHLPGFWYGAARFGEPVRSLLCIGSTWEIDRRPGPQRHGDGPMGRRGTGGGDDMPRGEDGKARRQWAPDARALSIVGDRWVMVIVRDLASGPLRLEALRRWLPGVSAGALESRLSRMADAGLITRRRRRSLPPRVDLELTEQGHALGAAIGALARWELRTQWSRPRDDEWVDVGACFRLAPLLAPAATTPANGQLALTIADGTDN